MPSTLLMHQTSLPGLGLAVDAVNALAGNNDASAPEAARSSAH